MWMVRNNGGEFVDRFLNDGMVGLGWRTVGSLAGLSDRESVLAKVEASYPLAKKQSNLNAAVQLDAFANRIKIQDDVITYDPSTRTYHLGRVVGNYEYRPSEDEELENRRSVEWRGKVLRDTLSESTRASLGPSQTIFRIADAAADEILKVAEGLTGEPNDLAQTLDEEINAQDARGPKVDLAYLKIEEKEKAKDRVVKLDWAQMQELVAGILRAMGYKTQVSPAGSDLGKDIVASPDGFGFEQPRIVVEVKHKPTTSISSQEIRKFIGGRHQDDRGLYVSTGGFTKEARYEADRARIPITLMDIDGLVDTLLAYYENLDVATRALIPLSKIYWPS